MLEKYKKIKFSLFQSIFFQQLVFSSTCSQHFIMLLRKECVVEHSSTPFFFAFHLDFLKRLVSFSSTTCVLLH